MNKELNCALSFTDSEGNVPLWEAIQNGHESIAKLLVDNGATLNAGDVGQFACFAAEQNRLDSAILVLLLKVMVVTSLLLLGQFLIYAAVQFHDRIGY